MSRFPSNINFTVNTTPNRTVGNFNKASITLHWWDDPSVRPQWGGVMSWLHNRSAQVSATYMTEAGRIAQLVPEKDVSWHAGHNTGNRHSIGIEVNPRLNAGDYEATAQLVAEIWRRYGWELPLHRHRYWNSSTACPGHMDINRIRNRARQINSGSSSTPAAPPIQGEVMTTPREVWSYGNESVEEGRQVFNMLRNATADAADIQSRIRRNDWRDWVANGVRRFRVAPLASITNRWDGIRADGYRISSWLQYGYLWARRAENRATDARNEAREVKAMIKAMARTQDELLKGQGAILKAVEEAETQVIRANADEVAAELEVTVREQDDEGEDES